MGDYKPPKAGLFSPIQLGNLVLQHRIVLAPLTRLRITKKDGVPLDIVAEHYAQRAIVPGTLLISEAACVAEKAGGRDNVPGIYSEAQIEAWRKVVNEVHARGSFIYCQIRSLGRAAVPSCLDELSHPYAAASAILLKGKPRAPRELTLEEAKEHVEFHAQAAENAIKAGFDGVEIHGANGYLLDQFLQDVTNTRSDEYGGSIENRSRFGLEVVQAVVDRIGAERTSIRLSPWSEFQEMKMKDPVPQFKHFINELATCHPNLAYIHLIEARVAGNEDATGSESLDFAREAWRKTGRPFIIAGGYTAESAIKHFDEPGTEHDCIAFGRYFISNPDLVKRIQRNIPFTPYDRKTFYLPESPRGYNDYPFSNE